MSGFMVTVYLGEGDSTTADDINAVVSGVVDAHDLVGVTSTGEEVRVRFRLAEDDVTPDSGGKR